MGFLSDSFFHVKRDGTWDYNDSEDEEGDSPHGDALINKEFKTEAGDAWILVNLYETNSVTDTRASLNSSKT